MIDETHSTFARMLWQSVPHDLTPALAEINRRGWMEASRDELLAIAVAKADLLPEHERIVPLNICWLLEDAAKEWLDRHTNPGEGKGHALARQMPDRIRKRIKER